MMKQQRRPGVAQAIILKQKENKTIKLKKTQSLQIKKITILRERQKKNQIKKIW